MTTTGEAATHNALVASSILEAERGRCALAWCGCHSEGRTCPTGIAGDTAGARSTVARQPRCAVNSRY